MFFYHKAARPLLLVLALFCIAAQFYAQEYLVTAIRSKEETLDTSGFTTVITSDDIKKSGKATIVELLSSVASLQITTLASPADSQISMRGFGENGFGRVLIMVDGRALNNPDMSATSLLTVPLSSIERIEIADGPHSALYGNNAVGGVINIITKENANAFHAEGSASVGSFWTANEQFFLETSGSFWGFNFSLDQYNTDGWRDRTGVSSTNAFLSTYFDATEKITIKPFLQYSRQFLELPASITKEQFETNPKLAGYYNDDTLKNTFGGGASFNWDISDVFFITLPLDYQFSQTEFNTPSRENPLWGTPPLYSSRLSHRTGARPAVNFQSDTTKKMSVFASAGFDFTGAFIANDDYLTKQRSQKVNSFTISQYNMAPYVQAKVSLPLGLSVQAAVRYDSSYIQATSATDKKACGNTWHNAFVYSADIVYRPIKQLSVYLRGGSLFRYPFLDEVAFVNFGNTQPFNTALKPETGYNAEGGVKLDFGKYFSAKVNAYYMPMTDEIAYNGMTNKNENMNKTMRLGTNVELQTQPLSYLRANASFSYVHAVFSDGVNTGKRIPLVSDFSVAANLSVLLPQGLSLTPDVSWHSSYFGGGDTANSFGSIPGYVLLGAQIRYSPPQLDDALTIALSASNLLNTRYSPHVYYGGYYPAAGRSFSIRASYRY